MFKKKRKSKSKFAEFIEIARILIGLVSVFMAISAFFENHDKA